jgi:hypothetical protein
MRLRQALGETRSLEEAPGCLCSARDDDDGLSLFVVSCMFLWDCWLFTRTGAAICLDHHARGRVLDPVGRLASEVSSELRLLDIGVD